MEITLQNLCYNIILKKKLDINKLPKSIIANILNEKNNERIKKEDIFWKNFKYDKSAFEELEVFLYGGALSHH